MSTGKRQYAKEGDAEGKRGYGIFQKTSARSSCRRVGNYRKNVEDNLFIWYSVAGVVMPSGIGLTDLLFI